VLLSAEAMLVSDLLDDVYSLHYLAYRLFIVLPSDSPWI
jgi:hypothetical protein